jgi:predicted DNA repair protein MutK
VPAAEGVVSWLVTAAGSASVGLVIGAIVIVALKLIGKARGGSQQNTH